MAQILYGVSKEGMGHAVRSRIIISELTKRHDVLILAGGKQFSYLSNYFKNILRVDGFDLVYLNNTISFTLTFLRNLIRLPAIVISVLIKLGRIKRFNPDGIISDFEPFSNYLSYLLKKPLIAVDNQHITTKCDVSFPKKFKRDFIISSYVISSIITNARYFLVMTYFFPKIKGRNVFLLPPVVREEVINTKATDGDHIIVYQTSDSYKKLAYVLKKSGFNFIFYGNKEGKEGNITFKKFCEKEFINDLASCKAVITNGGFGLISEAIYLKKPVLSIPVKKQFEQILNAIYLRKLGYGEYYLDITKKGIDDFIERLPRFKKNLNKFKKHGNREVIEKLEEIIRHFKSQEKRKRY